jgi:microcystin degradation protein MlrC
MRLFLTTLWAGCIHSSAMPLSDDEFEVLRGGVPRDRRLLHARWLPQFALRGAAETKGWEAVESICASANPGLAINDRFYQSLKGEIRADFARRGPFDAVVLATSGITRTFHIEDVEKDLLQIFQPARRSGTTVGFFTNCHSHLDETNLALLDVIATLKEYPHTDWADRATELFSLIEKTATREIRPTISVAKPGMVAVINTFEQPYRRILDKVKALEKKAPVASISILHGNLGVNTKFNELRVLVTTDNDPKVGQATADEIGREIFDARDSITPIYFSADDLIAKIRSSEPGPFFIADYLDNPFGGSAGDSTIIVDRLLTSGISNICCGPIFDPTTVKVAIAAGEGATLPVRVGGKFSRQSGRPLDIVCDVVAIHRDVEQSQPYNGIDVKFPTGTCAHLRSGDLDLIVSDRRQQTFSPNLFTRFGIDLRAKRCVVVKSKKEYEIQFKDISMQLFTIPSSVPETGDFRVGHVAFDLSKLPRPIWPLDTAQRTNST